MATVQELKTALVTEQSKAVDLADKAIGSIDTLLNLSMWVLGVLGFVVGILAIFGYGWMVNGAKKVSKSVSQSCTNDYIRGEEFSSFVKTAIEAEVRRRVLDKFILANISEEPVGDGSDAFPPASGAKRKRCQRKRKED